MARLPSKHTKSPLPEPNDRFQEAVADAIFRGMKPAAIAAKLAGPDKVKAKAYRAKVWKLVRKDANFAAKVAERAQAEMVMALGPAVTALGDRAGRGRPEAIKLLFEASGFHNPRVQHEHSGDIQVKVELPRPKAVDGQAEELDS